VTPADHVDFAVREMDDVETGIDERDAKCHEAVHHADRDADDDQVDEIVHGDNL
jgi:hypothetical protein